MRGGETVDVSTISTSAARPGQSPRELADRFDVLVAEYRAEGLEEWEAEAKAEDTMRVEAESAPPAPEPLTEPSSDPKPKRSSAGITQLRAEVAELLQWSTEHASRIVELTESLAAEETARLQDREQIDEMLTVIATTIRDLRALIPPGPDAELYAAERAAQPMLVLKDIPMLDLPGLEPGPPVGKIRAFFRWLW
jgi:hypothetical protein